MLYTLGFDIGVEDSTYCLLAHGLHPTLINCAVCYNTNRGIVEVLGYAIDRTKGGVLLCAVESVVLGRIGAVRNLLDLARVEAKITTLAEHMGQAIYRTPAAVWRDRLGLGREPDDATIHAYIRTHVRGWPEDKVYPSGHTAAQTNSHDRDAAGVSLAIATIDASWPPRVSSGTRKTKRVR